MVKLFQLFSYLLNPFFIYGLRVGVEEKIYNDEINMNLTHQRQAKILVPFIIPPYPFGKTQFPRLPCIGTDNKEGICLSQTQCITQRGASAGTCADNRGVCCVFVAQCGGSVSSRISYFTNIGYPNTFNGGTRCTLTISKQAPYICQLRLDFIDLMLASPTYQGQCHDDTFSFGGPGLPRLCGENSGLHGYVDFATNCNTHSIIVDTSSSVSFNRKWNIKISQVPCNSTRRAPRGCLMYFDSTSGTVSSYNFKIAAPPSAPNPGEGNTNMILNLNYGVCVRPALGYCSIVWSQSGDSEKTFSISGNTDEAPSQPISARNGADCTHNFVVIPNPMISGTEGTLLQPYSDRFCGNAFLDTTSSSKPFILTVVTGLQQEGDVELDINNRGFLLDFRQTPCRL